MYLIDTHAHLYLDAFDEDREEMISRAKAAGVQAVFLPNIDSSSIPAMLDLEAAHPDFCYAMMGLHPCSVNATAESELEVVRQWLERRPFKAVGEIGIDLYWDTTYRAEQEEAMLRQMHWALELDLPVVIHARNSLEVILDLAEPLRQERFRGIFHCFSGTPEQARRIIDLGFLLGIGGVVTYKKAGLDEVLRDIPLEYLVLETDSPYLAPVPHRGKRNESAYLAKVAARLAEIYGISTDEIGRQTTHNAMILFGIETGTPVG